MKSSTRGARRIGWPRWWAVAGLCVVVIACGDDAMDAPGGGGADDGRSDGKASDEPGSDDDGAAAGEPLPELSGGRKLEAGVTVLALTRPGSEPTRSRLQRLNGFDYDPTCSAPSEADAGAVSCEHNHPPRLGAPLLEINGLVYESLPEVLGLGDEVVVLVPFEDPDCNLACGSQSGHFSFESSAAGQGAAGGAGGALLPGSIPCDTESSGTYLGLYAASGTGEPGHYRFRLSIRDACLEDAVGARIEGMYEVR